jgi:hypothetical protein
MENVTFLDRGARESLKASCITALSVLPSLWAISSTSRAILLASEIVFLTTIVAMLSHQPLSKNDSYHAKAARETNCSEELLLRNRPQKWATLPYPTLRRCASGCAVVLRECAFSAVLPTMTVLGKVPCPTPI